MSCSSCWSLDTSSTDAVMVGRWRGERLLAGANEKQRRRHQADQLVTLGM
jgi:hypothetical protein